MTALQTKIDEWLRWDQNEESRGEILNLSESGNTGELEKRLGTRIEFGTAGTSFASSQLYAKPMMRSARKDGSGLVKNERLDLIVIQASQGLCEYVLNSVENATQKGMVIGHDHRHNSDRWAELTASAFVRRGVKVYLFRELVHTPMVPFSVKRLGAACGVMITASHNPKQDNGYKVYWENGVQIIGPHDKGISASILQNLEPKCWDTSQLSSSKLCIEPTPEMIQAYFSSIKSICSPSEPNSVGSVKFVNTSMHGVSDPFVKRGFELLGLTPYVPVKEQQLPDPDFPTVRFPNPEEKGALDLATKTANDQGISYVLAQDPDSDRFSAAEKSGGKWINFTGDQLGTLFAAWVLDLYKKSGKPIGKLAMVASTVSSKMIEAIARMEGFVFVECLTGFKFIGNTALNLVEQGFEVPFGYEEAIGFMFGSDIRDKDGVAATLSFAELVIDLKRQGKTVLSYLNELYARYGYFETSNSYFICNDPPTIDKIFSRIRNYDQDDRQDSLKSYPRSIASLSISRVVDLTTGYDSANPPSFKPSLPLSSGHMIQFRAGKEGDSPLQITLTLRTSGTEPKIKYYLEGNGPDASVVKLILPKVVQELGESWLEANKYGLSHG